MAVLQIPHITNINSMDELESLKQQLEKAGKKIATLEAKIAKYEENGPAKLFYSLSRKSWEMGDLLNSIDLKELAIDDPKDKSFERLRYIIKDSSDIAAAVRSLGEAAGITGDEKKDISKKSSFLDKFAD